MTVRIGTYLIEKVSIAGRIRLFRNSWFDNPTGINLIAGREYRLKIDSTKGVILSEVICEGLTPQVEIMELTDEIRRLERLCEAHGIDPTDPEHELDQFYQARVEDELEQPESWVDYVSPRNQLLVRKLLSLKEGNHQDRVKSTGRDIDSRIAELCDGVPVHMLPLEIRDHIPVTMTGAYQA